MVFAPRDDAAEERKGKAFQVLANFG